MMEYQHSVRIYHKDTDSLGVVHHSNYLVFFEQARTEALRSLGIELPLLLEQQGIQFAVAMLAIKYSKPAKLDDTILIRSKVKKLDKHSVVFNQQAFKNTDLICMADVRLAAVNNLTKLAIIPANVQQELMR
jgi:acyl-CoA thioester hydrolase